MGSVKDYETLTLYYRNWHIFPNNGKWCVCHEDWGASDYLTMPGLSSSYDYIDKTEDELKEQVDRIEKITYKVQYSGRVTS